MIGRNLQPLSDEIANDSEGRGYTAMTDQELLDDLHLERIAIKRRVPNQEMIDFTTLNGDLYVEIKELENNVDIQLKSAAHFFVDTIIDKPDNDTDFEKKGVDKLGVENPKPRIEHLVDSLVANDTMTTAQQIEFLALADVQINKVEQLYSIGVKAALGEVITARG